MTAPHTQQKGVTPPISLALPTTIELSHNDNLIAELKKQNNFEASDETERRYVSRYILEIRRIILTYREQKEDSSNYTEGHCGICQSRYEQEE